MRERPEPPIPAYISDPIPDRKGGDSDVEAGSDAERESRRVARLVDRAKGGDQGAFGELYHQYHPPIFRLARSRLSHQGAEDAVSETFLRAWTALPRYRDRGVPFVAWLYGIARHVVSDAAAAQRRVEPHAEPPDTQVPVDHGREDRMDLGAAIAGLSGEQRTVIELKFLVGLSNEEVARFLRKSAGAVNAQQWRALQALREYLRAHE